MVGRLAGERGHFCLVCEKIKGILEAKILVAFSLMTLEGSNTIFPGAFHIFFPLSFSLSFSLHIFYFSVACLHLGHSRFIVIRGKCYVYIVYQSVRRCGIRAPLTIVHRQQEVKDSVQVNHKG